MGKQPEGRFSYRIIQMIKQRGGYAWKVHGNEYQPKGTPDICATYMGWSMWCESKMPGNKPSPIQKYRINQLRRAGALVCVPYSLKDAVQMFDHVASGDHTFGDCKCLYVEPFTLTAEDVLGIRGNH